MAKVISFHMLHDANVCVCVGGQLIALLELERLFEQRYYNSPEDRGPFITQWREAIEKIQKFTEIYEYDIAVTSWISETPLEIFKTMVKADRWETADHHDSHAAVGYYDSPFNNALIISYDGGGNDGSFNVYHANRSDGIKHIEGVPLNLGLRYRYLACAISDVTSKKFNPNLIHNHVSKDHPAEALAGKMMGYSALGDVHSKWIPAFKDYYKGHSNPLGILFHLGQKIGLSLEENALDEKNAMDVSATSQCVFTLILCEQIDLFLKRYTSGKDSRKPDGIVLTGGCALNVIANQVIVSKFGYPVHVPPAPNDCGISVGAAWNIVPPSIAHRIHFSGLPLFDANMLNHFVKLREARQVSVADIAKLLTGGAIIGLVRGRQEFGTRALGHRSVIAFPDKADVRERVNALKSREWFRPLCPSVTVEFAPKLVMGDCANFITAFYQKNTGNTVEPKLYPLADWTISSNLRLYNGEGYKEWAPYSPYMSFAPLLTEESQKKFPAITHYDGTARYQTVSKEDDPWYHSLLCEVGKRKGGSEILLNTSFNIKGKPILNRISTALQILDEAPPGFLDYVIVEDWLFTPKSQQNN
ncbi:nodulation protein NolO-like [Anneissia japonica]|uniref:nodulation protein NolO-like n=1 Tax=Anneissia japonica TaxID=1529436 RepID=UPI0014255E3B|nr:nodulation protein NolO-like [Anneissia japonica]